MIKEIRTVCDLTSQPVLEIVKEEDGKLIIYEADDMDREIRFPAAVIPMFISVLERVYSDSK